MTNEIDLKRRYPESRLEDVTDAFMRGYQSCLETQPNTAWVKWLESLRHDEVKTLGDAVEQLMYESIEHGGDMGPNGNVWNGVDEGDVLTTGFINEWIARFESTLGRDRYSYEQLREISSAVGDAMEYAHDKAIEHPDAADPLWNLDEYVNRILKVAFEGETTLGRGTCKVECFDDGVDEGLDGDWFTYAPPTWHLSCGHEAYSSERPRYCSTCGRRVDV